MALKANDTQLVCLAEFIAKAGEEQILLENLHALIKLSTLEGGCIRYELNQSVDNPCRITFIEKWYDQKTFDEHCAKPYIVEFFNNGGTPDHVETFEVSLYKEMMPAQ